MTGINDEGKTNHQHGHRRNQSKSMTSAPAVETAALPV
jgi:hypothetical protein